MTVYFAENGTIRLEGACPVEDAETLQQLLLQHPGALVDWTSCRQAHTAIIQLLLAAAPALRGPAATAFLNIWIEPIVSKLDL